MCCDAGAFELPGSIQEMVARYRLRAECPGADRPSLVTTHGAVAMLGSGAGCTAEVVIHEPTYLPATVEGDRHTEVLAPLPFAITSPVWVGIDGETGVRQGRCQAVPARAGGNRAGLGEHGRFETGARPSDVMRTIDQAPCWVQTKLDR